MKKGTKDTILAIVILTWFFGSFVSAFYFINEEKGNISLAIFGQLALIFGIAMILSKVQMPNGEFEPNKNNKIGIIPLLLGIILLIISGIMTFSTKAFQIFFSEKIIPLIGVAVFPIVGLSTIIFLKYTELKNIKIYNNPIIGTCTDILSQTIGDYTLYTVVWSYFVDGQTRTFYDNFPNIDLPQIGDTCTLYVNPNNFNEAHKSVDIKAPKESYIFGLLFLILGSIVFYIAITSTFPNLFK